VIENGSGNDGGVWCDKIVIVIVLLLTLLLLVGAF
jgi:hypothetical protein